MPLRLLNKSKRKNDDKPKRYSRRRLLIAGILALVVAAGTFIYSLTRPRPNLDMPYAPLVYTTNTGKRYALNLQTGERSLTTSMGDPSGPPILPDGKWRISYWMLSNPDSHEPELPLVLQSTEDASLFLDTGHISFVGSESWSSDSQWIVFTSRTANCLSDPVNRMRITLPSIAHSRADYCLPGTYDGSPAIELWLFHIPTGDVFPITDSPAYETYAQFSPRQSQIAYREPDSVYVFDVNTRERRLLFTDDVVYEPHWSPDGQWIAFKTAKSETERKTRDLYIIRPDGTGLQRVATNVSRYNPVHWIP